MPHLELRMQIGRQRVSLPPSDFFPLLVIFKDIIFWNNCRFAVTALIVFESSLLAGSLLWLQLFFLSTFLLLSMIHLCPFQKFLQVSNYRFCRHFHTFGDLCEVLWVDLNLWMNWRPKPDSLFSRGFAFASTRSTTTTAFAPTKRLKLNQGVAALPSHHSTFTVAGWALRRTPPSWELAWRGLNCICFSLPYQIWVLKRVH